MLTSLTVRLQEGTRGTQGEHAAFTQRAEVEFEPITPKAVSHKKKACILLMKSASKMHPLGDLCHCLCSVSAAVNTQNRYNHPIFMYSVFSQSLYLSFCKAV